MSWWRSNGHLRRNISKTNLLIPSHSPSLFSFHYQAPTAHLVAQVEMRCQLDSLSWVYGQIISRIWPDFFLLTAHITTILAVAATDIFCLNYFISLHTGLPASVHLPWGLIFMKSLVTFLKLKLGLSLPCLKFSCAKKTKNTTQKTKDQTPLG